MEKSPFYRESGVTPDGARPKLKHPSKGRKRNHRDSVSKRRANAEQPKPHVVPKGTLRGVAGPVEGLIKGN